MPRWVDKEKVEQLMHGDRPKRRWWQRREPGNTIFDDDRLRMQALAAVMKEEEEEEVIAKLEHEELLAEVNKRVEEMIKHRTQGVVQLATPDEVRMGADVTRSLTPNEVITSLMSDLDFLEHGPVTDEELAEVRRSLGLDR